MQDSGQRACPHCGSDRTQGHGSFGRKDGTREQRRRCRACGRTFCAQTATLTYYLKKRQRWEQMPREMEEHRTVRGLAQVLGVRPATIFRWRHRLLAAISRQPLSLLTGDVGVSASFIRYSEKGSRRSGGTGAWGSRLRPWPGKPFRRFVDGKPSCVLMLCSRAQLRTAIAGQGRPAPPAVQAVVEPLLAPGRTVWARGFALDDQLCHQLGYHVPAIQGDQPAAHPYRRASSQSGYLYDWLRPFRGVATRYLSHYLAWFRQTRQAPELVCAA